MPCSMRRDCFFGILEMIRSGVLLPARPRGEFVERSVAMMLNIECLVAPIKSLPISLVCQSQRMCFTLKSPKIKSFPVLLFLTSRINLSNTAPLCGGRDVCFCKFIRCQIGLTSMLALRCWSWCHICRKHGLHCRPTLGGGGTRRLLLVLPSDPSSLNRYTRCSHQAIDILGLLPRAF